MDRELDTEEVERATIEKRLREAIVPDHLEDEAAEILVLPPKLTYQRRAAAPHARRQVAGGSPRRSRQGVRCSSDAGRLDMGDDSTCRGWGRRGGLVSGEAHLPVVGHVLRAGRRP